MPINPPAPPPPKVEFIKAKVAAAKAKVKTAASRHHDDLVMVVIGGAIGSIIALAGAPLVVAYAVTWCIWMGAYIRHALLD